VTYFAERVFIEERNTSFAIMHVEKNHRPSQSERRCFSCRCYSAERYRDENKGLPDELTGNGDRLRKLLSQVKAEEND
jgi:hypothetical protein